MSEHSPDSAAEPIAIGRDDASAALAQRLLFADYWFARPAARYGLALLLVLVSLAVRIPLDPLIGARAPFVFYFPAILVSSVLGGFGPGLLATLLSAALVVLQLGAPGGLDQPDLITTIAYAAIGIAISWIGELLLRARRQAASGTQEVLAREAHLQSILDTVPDAMIVIDETGADRVGVDTRFLYGLLWALIAATLTAGAVVAAGLAVALASGPLQP